MTKTLTHLPMGKIKQFIEENFENIEFSKKAIKFYEDNYIGRDVNTDDIIKLKDGNPSEVSNWLKETFNINMSLDGDYAIAAVLALLIEFKEKAKFDLSKDVNGDPIGVAMHKNLVSYFNSKKPEQELYRLNLKNKDFEMYVSKQDIDLSAVDKFTFVKGKNIHLELPLVKYEEEVDLTETFKGTSMKKVDNQIDYSISSAKALTILDLGLDKVEIKQVAAICMVMASATVVDLTRWVNINDNFNIYVKYKGRLVFASKMIKEDFIRNEKLEDMIVKKNHSPELF